MKAWSLAWNTAVVPLPNSQAEIIQVRRTGKGCLSYVVGSNGEAAVIDPSVEAGIYMDLARSRGLTIRYVLDTHVHADHLSRARELASRTGAMLLLPPQDRVRFRFVPAADGARIQVGRSALVAVHTPGHTPESSCYVLGGAAVFTGDTVFTSGIGRPDLHADPEQARQRARALFASLARIVQLDQALLVLPGHTSDPVPFDGRAIAAPLHEVASWLSDWLGSETDFVDRVTSNLPPTPPNFARIIELNEAGEAAAGDPTDLEAGANRCALR
jgi:glyoxylase-like metal-dependent hydrolase (beta-lactamase superfamily II)